MKPIDLNERNFLLPKHHNKKIIIITDNNLRHDRFALRIQKEYPDLVAAWYAYDDINKNTQKIDFAKGGTLFEARRLTLLVKKIFRLYSSKESFAKKIANGLKKIVDFMIIKKYIDEAQNIEDEMFSAEVKRLRIHSCVKKVKINRGDVNSSAFSEILKKHDAYFLVSLGGPLLTKNIIDSVKGLAINQHAGHSPEYKGSRTIEWALYHRDLNCLSNTVHITTSSLDSGPIIRRSNLTLHSRDHPHRIFLKSVALGTELMIEVIEEVLNSKSIIVFDQPKGIGTTFLSKFLTKNITYILARDYKNGSLGKNVNIW